MNVRRLSAHQKTVCAPFWGEANRQRPQNGANCDALFPNIAVRGMSAQRVR